MDDRLTQILLVSGPFLFGIGLAVLMYWLFEEVSALRDKKSLVRDFCVVLGWFIGGEAAVWGTFKVFDLNQLFAKPQATGIAFLSYLMGFGIAAAVVGIRSRSSAGRILQRVSVNENLRMLLLLNAFSRSIVEAAAIEGITVAVAKKRQLNGLRQIR